MKGARNIGDGRCPSCQRVIGIAQSGRLRRHASLDARHIHCPGSRAKPVEVLLAAAPAQDTWLRGSLPLPGGRHFEYSGPGRLTRDDVARIALTLLLHVSGEAEKVWAAAVAAGLVVDPETTR